MGWFIFVLYPNPYHLAASLYRLKNPPVMPIMVSEEARQLEDKTPREIEQFVYAALPYSYDWEVYNMPWYFPTLNEALINGTGDCKARYLLFASLMEELNLPYRKNVSLTHIWADYDGKPQTALENADEAMVVVDEDGRFKFSLPAPDLERAWRSFNRGFWQVMPAGKKYLLLTGFPLIYSLFYLPWPVLSGVMPPIGLSNPVQAKQRPRFALPYK